MVRGKSLSLSRSVCVTKKNRRIREGKGTDEHVCFADFKVKCARLFPSGSDVSLFYRRSVLFQVWAQANESLASA